MCQYAVTLLNGHYLCISMVLLTVGVCIQHTHTPSRLVRTWRHKERGRKGDLSVQLVFCSAGSNKNCLPGSPLRQGRLPRNPTGPPTIQTSDRGAVCTLYRDPITHHPAKHCSGHKMTTLPTIYSLLGEGLATGTHRSFVEYPIVVESTLTLNVQKSRW